MKSRQSGPDIHRHPWYWMFYFGIHFIASLAAMGVGFVLIFGEGETWAGLGLCGAALFALINGLGGFWELKGKIKRGGYLWEYDDR